MKNKIILILTIFLISINIYATKGYLQPAAITVWNSNTGDMSTQKVLKIGVTDEIKIIDWLSWGWRIETYSPGILPSKYTVIGFNISYVGYDIWLKWQPANWISVQWFHNCTHEFALTEPQYKLNLYDNWNKDYIAVEVNW